MYAVEANRYYYTNNYQSFKDAMVEFNHQVKEGRSVWLKKGNKVLKKHIGDLDTDIFKELNK